MIKRHRSYKKKHCSFKTEQKKDHRAVGGGLLLNNSFCFPSYVKKKKMGTNFAYFDNTAKSKAKVQQ